MASSAAKSRPQQPADSPVASLPTETLAQVLVASLEGLEPWERQQARMSFSKVCSGWYEVAQTGQELVVKDTRMAERLAKALTVGGAARRQKVKTLIITIEKEGSGRGERIGALVKLCRQMTSLELHELDSNLGSSDWLGKPARDALRELRQLRRLTMNPERALYVPLSALQELISYWPRLQELNIVNLIDEEWRDTPSGGRGSVATNLTRLTLTLIHAYDHNEKYLSWLVTASKNSLRHLDLGTVEFEQAATVELFAPMLAVAPQLLSFKIQSDCNRAGYSSVDYLVPLLNALGDVRTLNLGLSGFPLSSFCTLFQPLQHLQTLCISDRSIERSRALFSQLTPQSALAFAQTAPSLKFLVLPRQYKKLWPDDGRKAIARALRGRGGRYSYG